MIGVGVVGALAVGGATWGITKKFVGDPKTGRTAAPTPPPTHPPTNAAIPGYEPTQYPTKAPTMMTCPVCGSQGNTWCIKTSECYAAGTQMPSECTAEYCSNTKPHTLCKATCPNPPLRETPSLSQLRTPSLLQLRDTVPTNGTSPGTSVGTPIFTNVTACFRYRYGNNSNGAAMYTTHQSDPHPHLNISLAINVTGSNLAADFKLYRPVNNSQIYGMYAAIGTIHLEPTETGTLKTGRLPITIRPNDCYYFSDYVKDNVSVSTSL